jgi:RND family efflux transporter MFP subunit
MNNEVPESFESPGRKDTAAHTGVLGSGGHGYNEDETHSGGPRSPEQFYQAEHEAIAGAPKQDRGLGRGFWIAILVAAIALALIVVHGIRSRSQADVALVKESKSDAIPEVKVTTPKSSVGSGTLTLPGNTQPYVDTPIYSRTNGYLKKWYFDIGAHVRKGQLMATIETPEVDQQLQVAQADLKASQANLNLANITSARYQNLLKSNSVSKQETDQAVGDAQAKEAAVEASMAAVRRLEQLQGFENIYAPYDGVVTARNTDIGALITGGVSAGASANQLFRLASIARLRVFVSVPEASSGVVRDGASATLTADAYPGQVFTGVIARNANAIDPASRTLNVEVDVNNADGKLLPGAYVEVHFNVPAAAANLSIPANTLLFRSQGLQVAVVRNGKVALVPVRIAQDHGATVEVASGLTANDEIVLDPSDSIANGQQVTVKGGEK